MYMHMCTCSRVTSFLKRENPLTHDMINLRKCLCIGSPIICKRGEHTPCIYMIIVHTSSEQLQRPSSQSLCLTSYTDLLHGVKVLVVEVPEKPEDTWPEDFPQ